MLGYVINYMHAVLIVLCEWQLCGYNLINNH